MKTTKTNTKAKATKKLHEIARSLAFFGFEEFDHSHIHLTKDIQQQIIKASVSPTQNKQEALQITTHRAKLLRHAEAIGTQGGQPLLTYSEYHNSQKKTTTICIDIIGISRGIAEALLLVAIDQCLFHIKAEQPIWHLNCVGEKEVYTKFNREIAQYFKKHLNDLPAPLREMYKEKPIDILRPQTGRSGVVQKIIDDAPQSMNFLSEISRDYFKEILEYIEAALTMYEIDNSNLPEFEYESHTVGTSQTTVGKQEIALSLARYSSLSKMIGNKRELAAVGITLNIKDNILKKAPVKTIKQPSFYLIHVGNNAHLRALSVLATLEKSGLTITHGILKDKLTTQMMHAEQLKSQYLLIIGQKEFIENTVVVRNTVNRSEVVVPISQLSAHIKSLKPITS